MGKGAEITYQNKLVMYQLIAKLRKQLSTLDLTLAALQLACKECADTLKTLEEQK